VALDCGPDWENDPNWQPDLYPLETSKLEFFPTNFPFAVIHSNECKIYIYFTVIYVSVYVGGQWTSWYHLKSPAKTGSQVYADDKNNFY